MALAVCAVAMVGLGFALETSVISSSNDVQVLSIDLEDTPDGFNGQSSIDKDSVNELFKPTISTKKETKDGSTIVNYKLEAGVAYLKVFNNTDGGAKLTVSFATGGTSLEGMNISLQKVGSSGPEGNIINIEVGGEGKDIAVNTVYAVSVTSITLPVNTDNISATPTSVTVGTSGWSLPVTYSGDLYNIGAVKFNLNFTAEKSTV